MVVGVLVGSLSLLNSVIIIGMLTILSLSQSRQTMILNDIEKTLSEIELVIRQQTRVLEAVWRSK